MTEVPSQPDSAAAAGNPAHGAIPPAVQTGDAARETWRSEELLGAKTEVLIVHGTEVYRLRRTRQDKLILYK